MKLRSILVEGDEVEDAMLIYKSKYYSANLEGYYSKVGHYSVNLCHIAVKFEYIIMIDALKACYT